MPPSDGPVSLASVFSFSLPFGRAAGVPTRLSWTILLWMLFDTVGMLESHAWLMLPWAIAMPVLLTLPRVLVRIRLVRRLGGQVTATTLWAFGDITDLHVPLRPGVQFGVGAIGILVSLVIAGAAFGLTFLNLPGYLLQVLHYAVVNSYGLIGMNLLPCLMFDGSRWWRGALWPLVGLRRAVRFTIIGSYVFSVLFTVAGVALLSPMLLLFGIMLLINTINEDRMVRSGYDMVLETDPAIAGGGTRQSWWARMQARRQERRREREAAAIADEQQTLDDLLAKVSASGLPSLSARERKILQNISKRQKARLGEA